MGPDPEHGGAEAPDGGRRTARILADAAHDLRQPMQSARMFVHLLSEGLTDERQRALGARAAEALDQADALAAALFEAAELSSGARRPALHPTDLGALVAQVASDFAERAEARGAELRLGPGSPGGTTDAAALARLLRAVLCEATSARGPVRAVLGARRRDGRSAVQLVHAPAPAEEGPALRLLRVAAAALGHEVRTRRTPAGGSAVEVLMPAAEAPPPPAALSAPDATGPEPADGRLVAVAEDDALQLMALVEMLQGWGFRAVGAPDGRMLLRRLEAAGGTPDLVVADATLAGGGSGLEAIRAVRATAGRPVPALLVTGAPEGFRPGDLAAEGILLVGKPVRPPALRRAVERRLGAPAQAEPA